MTKIGFIGCGKMASAIINGIINSDISCHELSGSEVDLSVANDASERLNIPVVADNKKLCSENDVIFIATKPNCVKDIINGVKDVAKGKLVVSIAAGVCIETIENILADTPVIRVMPNTPVMVSEGMIAVAKGKIATDEHVDFIKELFSEVGRCIEVNESQIDIVTALSGSGPAFFYKIIDEMAKAGEKLGLDYDKSLVLAAQTAAGSAKMIFNSELSPEELVKSVATKGGCTEVGVNYLDDVNSQAIFFELINKTFKKASQLGK